MNATATAHGRALAMDRPGCLTWRVAKGNATGSAVTNACSADLRIVGATASGQVPAVVVASDASLVVVAAESIGRGACQGIGVSGQSALAAARVGASETVHVHPAGLNIRVEEFLLHRIGASLAGAQYTLMARTNPVHPVMEYDSQGPTDSDVISSVPVLWLDVMVSNSGTDTLYLMCFDSDTVPMDGALPLRQPLLVGAGGQTYVDCGDPGADGLSGRPTTNGLAWVASTTATTLTTDATNSLWVTARVITIGT